MRPTQSTESIKQASLRIAAQHFSQKIKQEKSSTYSGNVIKLEGGMDCVRMEGWSRKGLTRPRREWPRKKSVINRFSDHCHRSTCIEIYVVVNKQNDKFLSVELIQLSWKKPSEFRRIWWASKLCVQNDHFYSGNDICLKIDLSMQAISTVLILRVNI